MKKQANTKAVTKAGGRKVSGPSYAPAKPMDVLVRREVEGELYVMPVKRGNQHYFVIDGIAADLWSAFNGKTTLKEHIDRLISSNETVPPAKIKKDVTRFLASLKKLGLVD